MRPTVYIETTIPSYYCDDRAELRRDIERTRQWWDDERTQYECMISPIVLGELEQGDYPNKDQCLELIAPLPVLEIAHEVEEIVEVYLANRLMPRGPSGDAAHLAFASFYRIDFLLTWNCRHLANVRKEEHLRRINERLGLHVPRIVTPHNLQLPENEI